jgi:hypothetical protein
LRVAPGRHEADVLAVGLLGDREPKLAGARARLYLRKVAEREAQEGKLLAGRSEQEIALVAGLVLGASSKPVGPGRLLT